MEMPSASVQRDFITKGLRAGIQGFRVQGSGMEVQFIGPVGY
jgi:hypothetical protein